MTPSFVLVIAGAYLGLLFAIAYRADRRAARGANPINSSIVYALSLAVYCTSWTFYGSVGRAASSGIDFLPIYLGPTLTFCLGWLLLRRILRVSKAYRLTSIADFLAARYGNSAAVASLVAAIAVVGSVPYIALQLKAVSASFAALLHAGGLPGGVPIWQDTAWWAAIFLALFAIVFGTRKVDASEQHEGMVIAIAFESLVKLVSLTAVGLFVGFVVFAGFGDLFAAAASRVDTARLLRLDAGAGGFDWWALMLLAMAAVVCLPRQFQVMVVENVDERHLDRALWLFPLYLLLINIFVLPIALAGRLVMPAGSDLDLLVLTVPMTVGWPGLALLAFIGGLSAATGMIIVETVALSTMVSNDLIMPVLLRRPSFAAIDARPVVLAVRRGAIAALLLLGYTYMRGVGESYALVAIGLVSFAAVAQFFPAILLGLFWRRANRLGALAGVGSGALIWLYTLMLPSLARSGWLPAGFIEDGLLGVAALRPYALFGLAGLDAVTHSLFWSMLANVGALIGVSMLATQSSAERSQAALFIDSAGGGALGQGALWRGRAALPDLAALLVRFLGPQRTDETLARHARRHAVAGGAGVADAELVRDVEHLLAGAIGSASARVMIASVVEEEPLGIDEVMRILDETSRAIEYSRRLEEKSRELEATAAELRAANKRLRELDQLKDDFVSTVSHELRTPLTSVRAFSEILLDSPDLDVAQRRNFLAIIVKESERLTRLINDMLDLAKIESGRLEWHIGEANLVQVARDAAAALGQLFRDKDVRLTLHLPEEAIPIEADRDRLVQVTVNLLSNAVKFSPPGTGRVVLSVDTDGKGATLSIADNGPGIAAADQAIIFERFRQGGDTLTAKPEGTGLGLAICRMIVDHFGGRIWIESEPGHGAIFRVYLPLAAPAAAAVSRPAR